MSDRSTETPAAPFNPGDITRPDPALLTYYIIVSILTLPAFVIVFPISYFKYRTLKYEFDDKGVSMSWGILFHRQIYLTYRRIQDIHVSRNIIHRKLGLAAVAVQTASGSAGAEMTIEGIRHPEALRDYLYAQMRGARDDDDDSNEETIAAPDGAVPSNGATDASAEALALLVEIRDGLRALRDREHAPPDAPPPPSPAPTDDAEGGAS